MIKRPTLAERIDAVLAHPITDLCLIGMFALAVITLFVGIHGVN